MLRKNFLKGKLAVNRYVLGTWSILSSPLCVDVIASSGVDFVILDREHGTASFETIVSAISICENHGVSPIVRIPEATVGEVQRALDAGAHGLHIPNITCTSQLENIIELAKYPPLGKRGFSPFTRAAGFSAQNSREQLSQANDNTLLAIHIEGIEGISHLDEFLKYSELDIIFVGLFDLSKSLGVAGDITHHFVYDGLKKIAEKCKNCGKIVGTI